MSLVRSTRRRSRSQSSLPYPPTPLVLCFAAGRPHVYRRLDHCDKGCLNTELFLFVLVKNDFRKVKMYLQE